MSFDQNLLATLIGLFGGANIMAIEASHHIKDINQSKQMESISVLPVPVMLATKYHKGVSVDEFFISEKFDGVRAYWTGHRLMTRSGRAIHAPDWFIREFPPIALDGELWIERGQFEKVSGLVRSKNANPEEWKKVSFQVFDLPTSRESFSNRIDLLEQLTANSQSQFITMVKQHRVENHSELTALLDSTVAQKGEGLMLQHQDGFYTSGRSQQLLKLKLFEDDEATVLNYLPGNGKYRGMMGAIQVKNAQGQVFKIGSGFTDQQRKNPPKIGSLITYRYRGKTVNDLPRFATFLRERVTE